MLRETRSNLDWNQNDAFKHFKDILKYSPQPTHTHCNYNAAELNSVKVVLAYVEDIKNVHVVTQQRCTSFSCTQTWHIAWIPSIQCTRLLVIKCVYRYSLYRSNHAYFSNSLPCLLISTFSLHCLICPSLHERFFCIAEVWLALVGKMRAFSLSCWQVGNFCQKTVPLWQWTFARPH